MYFLAGRSIITITGVIEHMTFYHSRLSSQHDYL